MIWSVVTKTEMEGFGTNQVFRFYREALGKQRIKLAVVDDNDSLDFVGRDDIVILRTASLQLIDTIKRKGIVSTAENYRAYKIVSDKIMLGEFLRINHIDVPRQFYIDELIGGMTYFVKPRFGSDSKGISQKNICKSKSEVNEQVIKINNELGQEAIIEEFVDGFDCTVSCIYNLQSCEFISCAIEIECDETGSVQTRDCKVGFKECCYPMSKEEADRAKEISKKVFGLLGLKHHARIDFRKDKNGNLFVIDVNLLPGLGPLDHFAKSLLLEKNMSYVDAIKAVVSSASA